MPNINRKQRPFILAPIAIATCLSLAMPMALAQGNAAAPNRQAASIQVSAGSLAPALASLARQTGTTLVVAPALVQGKQAPAIAGNYTVQEAFDHLLAGSGLTAQINGKQVIVRDTSGRPASNASSFPEVVVTAEVDNSGITEGTGSYTQTGPSGAATGLALSLRETPQSVTVMTSQRMEDFKLETLSDVMDQTPGITVFRQGSHIGYQARGTSVNLQTEGSAHLASGYAYFGSTNFTLDNMIDIDRIEVLKGSNGLLVGKGSTGATVNMVRKRPTRDFQAHVGASTGSWSNHGINADISNPLNATGSLRGRLAAAATDGDGFREYEKNKTQTLYGTVEADLTANTVLATGLTYRKRDVRGLAMWTNIVAYQSSAPGEFLGWQPRSYNPGAPWSGYEQESTNIFARLEHQFSNGWTSKVQMAHENIEIPELLLGDASGDFDTATRYLDTKNRNSSIIADLKGPVTLFGRTHDMLLGAGASNGSSDYGSNKFGDNHHTWQQRYAYAASRINLADPLKLIAGARITNYENKNLSMYDDSGLKETGTITPYAGLVFDISQNISLYGSYASIFEPQSNQDEQGRTLAPREGLTYEIGAKGEFFDKRLNASISHFWIRTDNEPEQTGGRTPSGALAYRAIMGASRRGYELEMSGELARGWQLQGGYTMNSSNLSNASTNPKQQFKLGSTYRFGSGNLEGLSVGAATRWQSTTTASAASFGDSKVQQASYWLLDLMTRYQVNDQLSISANINNLLDKQYKYVVSGYQGLAYTWGAPRSFTISARYDF